QQKLSPTTDIYALTATLYYLLTGKTPTPGALRLSQAVPQTLKFSAKELKDFQPNLTPGIEKTILMGLEIDAEKRPQTVESWLALLLNESNILEVKKQNSYLTQKASIFNNNDKFTELQSESTIEQKVGKYITNEVPIKKVDKRNIKPYNDAVFTPSYTDNKFSWINQLSLQLTIFLLFVLTAGTFGWIGFNITLRYSHAKTNNKIASLTSSNLLESLKQEQNYTFRNHDPSSPLFGSPSVKTYSMNPPKLNKLPKPYFEQNEFVPNSLSVSNEDESWSEKADYSADVKTQVSPENYSSNDNSAKVDLPKRSYYPSDYKPKYPQQNQYPDDYY
ncbi:MAG: hypothetical protein F6K22_05165, partial [Okeania sp. SIO2F4]|nr:hypothetical protein [Okeania sp. SIO2F4]